MNYFLVKFLKLKWFYQQFHYQWNHQLPHLFFDDLLFYYYINLISSIIFSLFSGDIYLSLGISWSFSFVTVSDLFSCEFFATFVILWAILLRIKLSVASAVSSAFLQIVHHDQVVSACIYCLNFYLYFCQYFYLHF